VTTPTTQELRKAVTECLQQVAPEADVDLLDPTEDLREQLDIDSMDLLNFVVAIHERLGVEIPEADFRAFRSLESAVEYLAARGSK
jgi:acyl carrier protein